MRAEIKLINSFIYLTLLLFLILRINDHLVIIFTHESLKKKMLNSAVCLLGIFPFNTESIVSKNTFKKITTAEEAIAINEICIKENKLFTHNIRICSCVSLN